MIIEFIHAILLTRIWLYQMNACLFQSHQLGFFLKNLCCFEVLQVFYTQNSTDHVHFILLFLITLLFYEFHPVDLKNSCKNKQFKLL